MRHRRFLLVLLALAAVVAAAAPVAAQAEPPLTSPPPGSTSVQPRIVGGTPVADGQLGFVALVLYESGGTTFQCGGTVVDRRWILTAAHCTLDPQTLAPLPPSAYAVRTDSVLA